jgi:hypothetical protein
MEFHLVRGSSIQDAVDTATVGEQIVREILRCEADYFLCYSRPSCTDDAKS